MDNKNIKDEQELLEMSEDILKEVRDKLTPANTYVIPKAEFANLGPEVASMLPLISQVTKPLGIDLDTFLPSQAKADDMVKLAKNKVPAVSEATGASADLVGMAGMAGMSPVGINPAMINPAVILVGAALFAIERDLAEISETQKDILSFLENEKEAEIEADVETLVDIIRKYKDNWNNEKFMASNHKMVLDIQRTARKNINAYQKLIDDINSKNRKFFGSNKVNKTLHQLIEKFRYYKLSLFTYSMASLLEIMLSANFNESYISGIRDNIAEMSYTYRAKFNESSLYLENISNKAIDSNMLKSLGEAQNKVGSVTSSVPFIRKFSTDGSKILDKANDLETKALTTFAGLNNPAVGVFTEKMDDMIRIYNHTDAILMDKENIYLVDEDKLR